MSVSVLTNAICNAKNMESQQVAEDNNLQAIKTNCHIVFLQFLQRGSIYFSKILETPAVRPRLSNILWYLFFNIFILMENSEVFLPNVPSV